ncbi:MAG: phage baseplate assembly protein V [Dysgonamonadaceae bacterium]|jgi:Rhs element Vgr protein|nr:phage baseplate assembly protein V [Dysgonamonadaceae bacterium]
MALKVDYYKISIDSEQFKEYNFTFLGLEQQLYQPSKLRFLMFKKTTTEAANDIRLSLSKELLGKKVTCSLITQRTDATKRCNDAVSFQGIVFNMNVVRQDLNSEMAIEVVAYSPDRLLHDNPHCYSYENETLKDIVSKTLNPYKIDIQNSPRMGQAIPYIVQYNESNYAFLKRLALRFGEWLYYDGKKMVFGEIKKSECIELKLGYDILNYQYLLDMQHLNFSHAQHNYLEYENPKTEVSSFTGGDLHPMTDVVYKSSEQLYEKATFAHLQVSSAEGSFDETAFSTKAHGLGKKSQMMKCIGTSHRADLQIGSVIRIKESYEAESNKTDRYQHEMLLVYGIVHAIDENGTYYNQFTAIPADCEYPPYTYGDCSPKANTQRAVVKDNRDPEKLGRVRVQFLWQQEQDANLMTPWIRIAQPHGGGDKGFYFIPEIDEEVIVGFENGNAEKPYVIGTLYHGKQRPDGEKWYSEKDDIKAIRTRSGHTIEFHDTEGEEKIEIYDHDEKRNFTLTFSAYEQKITLHSKGDIELEADENIKLTAGKNIIVTTKEESITLEAATDISLDAKNDISAIAENNIEVTVTKDMTTTVKNENTVIVTKDQIIDVGGNNEVKVTKNYQLKAKNILEEASDKMQLFSKTHEQKADNMKLEGTRGLEAKGLQLKEN